MKKVLLAVVSGALLAVVLALVTFLPKTATVSAQTSCYNFARTLRTSVAITKTEAAALQRELAAEGFWDVSIPIVTYDDSVAGAVTQLQEANAQTILVPNKLSAGTGVLGLATRTFLNKKYGCPGVPINPVPATATNVSPVNTIPATTVPAVTASACPAGYVCTPTVTITPVACPAGYTCIPNGANGGTYSGGAGTNGGNSYTNGGSSSGSAGSGSSYSGGAVASNGSGSTYPTYSFIPTDYSSYFGNTGGSSYANNGTSPYTGTNNGGSGSVSVTLTNTTVTPGTVSQAAAVGGAVGDTTQTAALTQDTTTNDPPVGTNLPAYDTVVTSAPVSTPLTFTVDYSKSLAAALSSAGINTGKVDDNIMLGLYPFSGNGTKSLTLRVVTAKDLFPELFSSSNSSVVSNTYTANQIFNTMKSRGYRPVTLQELLAFKAAYPQYFGSAGAIGSMVHFSTPVQLSTHWQNSCPFNPTGPMKALCYVKSPGNTYSYVIPQVTANAVNLLPVISLDGYNPINAESLKSKSWKTTMTPADKFYVIDDGASPATTVAEVPAAPTTLKSGPYAVVTSESYSVNVDYGKSYPKSTKNVNDTVAVPSSGTKPVVITFAQVHGVQWTDDNTAKSIISTIPGYRPATAQELLAMNEQYPNKFDGVMGFGSINPDCGGFPVLYKRDWTEYVGTPNLPAGVTNPKGATGYLDKTIVDINACIVALPDSWFASAAKDSKGGIQSLDIIAAGNAAIKADPTYASLSNKNCQSTSRNTNYWKYAVVKL